jgi:hypothetical protein
MGFIVPFSLFSFILRRRDFFHPSESWKKMFCQLTDLPSPDGDLWTDYFLSVTKELHDLIRGEQTGESKQTSPPPFPQKKDSHP